MSKVKKLLNEIAKYPHDAYVSSRRMARMMADVLEECSHKSKLFLYADANGLYVKNNIKLIDDEHIYLMRLARRSHGCNRPDESRGKRKRWTFCWQGSAISFQTNISGAEFDPNQPTEYVVPEMEGRSTSPDGDAIHANGPILDVIRQLSIKRRHGAILINTGLRTDVLKQDRSITAHFALAVTKVSGRQADKAAHPDYCRRCHREVLEMARFKVAFSLQDGEVLTRICIE